MEPKLEIEYLESDPSKIWVNANNSTFAGATEDYLNEKYLSKLVDELDGFPETMQSEVLFELGKESGRHSYCKLHFYCCNSIGHSAVIVTLANDLASNESEDNRCLAKLKLQFEASALDTFRASLLAGLKSGKGKATLMGISEYTQYIK